MGVTVVVCPTECACARTPGTLASLANEVLAVRARYARGFVVHVHVYICNIIRPLINGVCAAHTHARAGRESWADTRLVVGVHITPQQADAAAGWCLGACWRCSHSICLLRLTRMYASMQAGRADITVDDDDDDDILMMMTLCVDTMLPTATDNVFC